jgi:hypothetical protein
MSKPGSPTLGSLRANRPEATVDDQPINADDISDAAEALREVEIQAAREDFDFSNDDTVTWSAHAPVQDEYVIPVNLEELSIDELRAVAGMLRIPNYGQITDQEELVSLIREYAVPAPRQPR